MSASSLSPIAASMLDSTKSSASGLAFLSAIMSTSVEPIRNAPRAWRFSKISETEGGLWLADCRDLTSKIYDGLDLSTEIHQLCKQQRGDTVFLRDESSLNGFAVCHYGPASEAGADSC